VDFGSVVAAPYVKMILEDSLNYLGVEPSFDEDSKEETKMITVPDVTGKSLTDAAKELRDAGLDYLAEQTGTEVVRQMPLADAEVMVGTTVLLYTGTGDTESGSTNDQLVEVPDVKNKSIREVNNILTSEGLRLRIDGAGLAVSQNPESGTMVEPDTLITVTFEAPE
jgi:stage V sporulation protein D (sporulation-specific penicillin-binding protein)